MSSFSRSCTTKIWIVAFVFVESVAQTCSLTRVPQTGCICCTFRDDMLNEIARILKPKDGGEKEYDFMVIEGSGIAEPKPIAETFTAAQRDNEEISKYAYLDTLVTVVDSDKFLEDYNSMEQLKDRKGWDAEDVDSRHVAQLLVEQVETSNVLVMNKMDLLDKDKEGKLEAIVRPLNPKAKLIKTSQGQVPRIDILGTSAFDYNSLKEIEDVEIDDAIEHADTKAERIYGITSFLYKSRKPFHPATRILCVLKNQKLVKRLRWSSQPKHT